jgi:outer membrane protein OmpA-like peptidoglycan-associated protein
MIKTIPILLATLMASLPAWASTPRLYVSPMETSRWELTTDSVLRCEIEHDIPRFGKAVFYQESGRGLKLEIRANHSIQKNLDIVFRSVTASWKGVQYESELARLKSPGGKRLIDVATDNARNAYVELEQGFQPSVFFQNPEDDMNHVAVVLSTVNFRDVQDSFSACIGRLHPDHFDDVRMARVHFDFDDEFPLVADEERAFKRMLSYMQVDPSVHHLVISGHADFKGTECYNDTLSARRAWYVYDLLVQSGVDPAKLQVEFHGESRPLKKGKSDESRAANRRVTVTMHK